MSYTQTQKRYFLFVEVKKNKKCVFEKNEMLLGADASGHQCAAGDDTVERITLKTNTKPLQQNRQTFFVKWFFLEVDYKLVKRLEFKKWQNGKNDIQKNRNFGDIFFFRRTFFQKVKKKCSLALWWNEVLKTCLLHHLFIFLYIYIYTGIKLYILVWTKIKRLVNR